MITEYRKINGTGEDEKTIEMASEIIRAGGLVAIPTETVYGLAGSALLEESAGKIYAAKGRPSDNPLIVHIAYPEDAARIAYPDETYYRLAGKFMPGPLTIILKKKSIIPDAVTGGLDSVAIRCPSNPVAHRLIEVSGHPIAAPSANRSGIPSPTCAEHVKADMDGLIDMIIDGGPCDIGVESTVVKIDGGHCTILRPGAVTLEMLSEVCESVSVAGAVVEPSLAEKVKPESPGMKYKHYSPKAKVVLVDAGEKEFCDYVRENKEGRCGVIVPDECADMFEGFTVLSTGRRGDASEYSRRLFAILRRADDEQLDTVYAPLPPKEGCYLAVYNRIIRAAGGNIVKLK